MKERSLIVETIAAVLAEDGPGSSSGRYPKELCSNLQRRREKMKPILMVAFHYPPLRGSSGIQRTLKFSRYLPDHGWQPIILTANPRAYPEVGDELLKEIPSSVVIKRAFALDILRHFSWRGRYLKSMALPDRWSSWWFGAILLGVRLIQRYRPRVIWSTYPIATAHLIGLTLHRLTGVPWVADFRDSMTEENYPQDPLTRRCYLWIEKQTVRKSSLLVFTAKTARQMYLERYPFLSPQQCIVILNGYDEEDFSEFPRFDKPPQHRQLRMRLLHSGTLYPKERDPRAFFKSLSLLKQDKKIDATTVSVELRASGSENYYAALIRELAIEDIVSLLPSLPYRQALADCADADGLLIFQAASCNHQIPAKVYEYLRLRKPILALTDAQGDTAALLKDAGGATIVDLMDEHALYEAIPRFLTLLRETTHPLPSLDKVQRYTRESQTADLAEALAEIGHIDPLR